MIKLLTLLVLTCVTSLAAVDRPVVVASTTQIADFARQIGGDAVEVICILQPGADPHSYQPTTRDAELVLGADLCLENGLHLEGSNWMATLAKDAGKRVVTCTDGVQLLRIKEDGEEVADPNAWFDPKQAATHVREDGEEVADPHAWFDPKQAATYVRNITAALCELVPDKAGAFQARAELYRQQLRILDAWIKQQVAVIPAERRVLVTSHDAFNYFCQAYGFINRAPVGWSTAELEGGVTPVSRQRVIDAIAKEGIPAVFVETSVSRELLTEIATEAGVAIGGTLYSDSMGTADSAGASYIGMMRENVLVIVEGLR